MEKKNIFLEEKKIGKGKGGKYFLGTTSLSIILSQSQSNQVYETAVSQFVTDKGRLDNEVNSGPIKIRCVQNNQPHSLGTNHTADHCIISYHCILHLHIYNMLLFPRFRFKTTSILRCFYMIIVIFAKLLGKYWKQIEERLKKYLVKTLNAFAPIKSSLAHSQT